MSEPIEPPVRWLLREIEGYLPQATYDKLVERFIAHKRRYDRASLLRHTRRELAIYEHTVTTCSPSRQQHYRDKIANRKRRIAELEAELDSAT